MKKITIFENIWETKKPHYIFIEHAFDRIKNGKSKDIILKIRAGKDAEKIDVLKKTLPSVCFSGTFTERFDNHLISHSGFICLDFDYLKNIEEKKEQLKANKYIYACWISPKGQGLKCIVKIPAIPEKHTMFFEGLKTIFSDIDPKCGNLSRVCFESYDPDIYINTTAETFDIIIEPDSFDYDKRKPIIPLSGEGEIITRLEKWMINSGEVFSKGNRNNYIMKFASAFNRYGISEYSAINFLTKYAEKDFPVKEIEATVKSAYKDNSMHAISYFENVEIKQQVRREIRSGKNHFDIAKDLSDKNNIKNNDAMRIVSDEKDKLNNRIETFWTVETNAKGTVTKIDLNRKKFINFLHSHGFFRHKITTDYCIYIREYDNVIEEVNTADIKHFIFHWIDSMEDVPFDNIDKHVLYEYMAKGVKTFFDKSLLDLLDIKPININHDTGDTAYFYYINGAVKITAKGRELINYCDLHGKVWKNHIIQRHIFLKDSAHENTYTKFLDFITNGKESKENIVSVIGYLLHRHKDKKISKSIIFNDMQVTDNPEGGSGKGLIINGIGQIRKVITIDGKTFTPDKSFAFQRVELDTEIMQLDDLRKDFPFESLFSIITEGVTIEKKNKGEFFIPFEDSPKLVITTNYYMRGEGASNDRRKLDVEINNFFNAKHTPFDEFGHTLFSDWDATMWNDFDNSMIEYCKYYLKVGLRENETETISYKKLKTNTSEEFLEWAIENLKYNEMVNRRELFLSFIDNYSNYHKLAMKKFIKWIETYCKHHKYIFNKDYKRSGNDFYIYIKTI